MCEEYDRKWKEHLEYVDRALKEYPQYIGGGVEICSCICHVPIGGGAVVPDVAYLDSCIHCEVIGGSE